MCVSESGVAAGNAPPQLDGIGGVDKRIFCGNEDVDLSLEVYVGRVGDCYYE